MDLSVIATVSAITIICYLIGDTIKLFPEVKNEAVPSIVGICGGVLGIIGMFVIKAFPADNILDAIAIGIVSGLASTGVNQVYKQAKK